MKKWLNLFLIISTLNFVFFLPAFDFHSVQAQSGVSVTARILGECGNGFIEFDEACDDGDNNGKYGYCNDSCTGLGSRCGDGVIQSGEGEECDDGNTNSGDGCSSICQIEQAPPGGGIPYWPRFPSTKVILQGKAYPYASIFALKDGNIVTTARADSLAAFKIEIKYLTGGTYTFGLWAEDKAGRKSITFSLTATVASGMTTVIGDILIPPTIGLAKTQVERGEILRLAGQAAPQSEITIYIKSLESQETIMEKTKADDLGDWIFSLDTTLLIKGSYSIKANAVAPDNLVSGFSHSLEFVVGKARVAEICPKADFDQDGKTNLVDFSILLYWWGKYDSCVDQNTDGIVNLVDFSILMYWWTG